MQGFEIKGNKITVIFKFFFVKNDADSFNEKF